MKSRELLEAQPRGRLASVHADEGARALPLVPIARAEGAWLYDFDGRRYLDAISSWWVNLFGHANPRINAAIARAARRARARDARRLHARAGGRAVRAAGARSRPRRLGHCFYASDGASAIEIALKMSFHYWRNAAGRTRAASSRSPAATTARRSARSAVTDVALFRDAYAPLLRQAATVPSPDARRADRRRVAGIDVARRCAAALEGYLAEHHDEIAALIVEPLVQGAGGMRCTTRAICAARASCATRYDVHLIADEIMTGFGRTGTMFACEQAGDRAGFPVPVERHHRRLPAAVVRADDRRGLRRVLRRRRRARVPAFALVHRQRAGLPRGARGARYLRATTT